MAKAPFVLTLSAGDWLRPFAAPVFARARFAFSIQTAQSRESLRPIQITLSLPCGEQRRHNPSMKYWEIIADNLSKAGWSWGCVLAIDRNGQTIFVADAHRDDGKRFVVHADEKLTAFVGLNQRFAQLPTRCSGCFNCVRLPVIYRNTKLYPTHRRIFDTTFGLSLPWWQR